MRLIAADSRLARAVDSRPGVARRLFEWGGFAAGAVLIAVGIGAIAMGFAGRATVVDSLKAERIVGTPDMTPALTGEAIEKAGLAGVEVPDCSVAGASVDSGAEARCFAEYMRVHALEATGGYAYAEMGRYQARPDAPKAELAIGGGTDNPKFAAVDPKTGEPASNGAREVWVIETALGTALNASFMADRIGLFGIVVGFALLLTGIGLAVLAFVVLRPRRRGAST